MFHYTVSVKRDGFVVKKKNECLKEKKNRKVVVFFLRFRIHCFGKKTRVTNKPAAVLYFSANELRNQKSVVFENLKGRFIFAVYVTDDTANSSNFGVQDGAVFFYILLLIIVQYKQRPFQHF